MWIVRRRPPLLAGLAVATALSVVLSPIAWQFYIVIAALPMAYALSLVAQRGFRALDVMAILVVAVLLGLSYHQWIAMSDLTGSRARTLWANAGRALAGIAGGSAQHGPRFTGRVGRVLSVAVRAEPIDRLRDDVRLLGELVGGVLREQGGGELFEAVEHVRTAAIGLRSTAGVGPARCWTGPSSNRRRGCCSWCARSARTFT